MVRPRFALLLLALSLLPAACARGPTGPPNLLVVVIDTLRADRLGAFGNVRGLTPFLDQLARRGTLFERAYAPSSWTMPSVASLLTSRYPIQHRVTTFFSRLAEDELTLPEVLRDAGWLVGGFSANPNLRAEAGFGQGFDDYWSTQTAAIDLPGDTLREQALGWLSRVQNRTPPAPLALYLQYMEPHEPYDPPEPFRSRFVVDDDGKPLDVQRVAREVIERAHPGATVDEQGKPLELAEVAKRLMGHRTPSQDEVAIVERAQARMNERLYDAEVAAADEQIRRLFADLEEGGFLTDDTVVVITADHGEEFLEHGGTSHGFTLYEESVRVPLILLGRGVPRDQRVRENVSLVDLAPTLLDLLGIPRPPRFEGRSLLGELSHSYAVAPLPEVLLQLERMFPAGTKRGNHSRAIVRRDDKLVTSWDGTAELYDLAGDPGELRALESGDPGGLGEALSSAEASLGARATPAEFATIAAEQQKRLRALGYMQ